ncbi:PTS sugar transporter subunit IIA [Vibrio mimicus]|uniref:PTS fructose transporter subunit IIA n=1 Tax=Vibrio mimicus TaxID=674 RepID=A0A2J9UWY3_VIBMI|nr:PTS sugar transporter subunit IIA [Vibrio mimicus]EEW11528.1 phosphotransferase system mannitol/fructose-specific IIA [Vibrio mimicus VM573]EGU20747.1 phosphotransferase system mannitol/fructose-specific IIA domain-containing protein [Vibrio mimicus SX-4]PNM56029.1 PTS fructose transporter subunit IIA [Vibrio mimicus]
MMHEFQVTFLVKNVNASAHVAQPLSRVARKFKSTLHIINITRNRSAELIKSLAVLQVGLQVSDLCQITAFGIDAELACFVIKDMLSDHYTVVGSKINYEFSSQLAERLPQICPPSEIKWHYAKAQTELTKFECLKGLAQLIYPNSPDELILAFIKREERSSTCVAPGIAIPHVMFEDVEHITVAVIKNDESMDWASKMGDVHLAIALVMPNQLNREQIIAATNLTRNLLCDQMVERLLLTRSGVDLQALLMYAMSRLLN